MYSYFFDLSLFLLSGRLLLLHLDEMEMGMDTRLGTPYDTRYTIRFLRVSALSLSLCFTAEIIKCST